MAAAERLQRNRLPAIAPLLDGWQLAGRSRQAAALGGAFHDWFSLPKGMLAVAVGRAAEQGIVGAMNADAVLAALRSHAQHGCRPERILRDANLTLWTSSAGDRHVTGLLALLDPASGRLRLSSAGRPSAVWLRADGWESLSQDGAQLGESPETKFSPRGCQLRPGEAVVLWTDGGDHQRTAEDRERFEAALAERLQPQLNLPTHELVQAATILLDAGWRAFRPLEIAAEDLAAAATMLDGGNRRQPPGDRAIVVLKRTSA
jgi:serine/threonine-protein kinase RsbW